MRRAREITAGEENMRMEEFAPGCHWVKRSPVEPEPVGTYVACVFRITEYRPDCDGSLMATLEQVDEHGEVTGWTVNCIGLYPNTDVVLEKIKAADAVLIASPVWWLSVSTQVKALIDHFGVFLNEDFTSRIPHKRFGIICVCGGKEEAIAEGAISQLSQIFTILNFDLVATLPVAGFDQKGAVAADIPTCEKARELGRTLVTPAS